MTARYIVQLPGVPDFTARHAAVWDYRPGMRVVVEDRPTWHTRRWRLGTVRSVEERAATTGFRGDREYRTTIACDDGEIVTTMHGGSDLRLLDGTEPLVLAGGLSVSEEIR